MLPLLKIVLPVLLLSWLTNPVHAQSTYSFDLPAQPLSVTLDNLAQATQTKLLYADNTVKGLTAAPIKGRYTV
ncbi:MAG: hypothetical protein RI993_1214, partial [Pseudomonadota bacterium]